ncbi:hypothetical protein HY449_03380 [Candidatus Pacearchaeota archaeon]|nr:hypothetical protein [Candidatus Pacearchaeota archaeon]
MGVVIKRNGKAQAFSGEKIKKAVEKAAKDAGISSLKRNELIQEVAVPVINLYKNKRAVKAVELRKSILKRLGRRAKSAVSAWRRYEKRK